MTGLDNTLIVRRLRALLAPEAAGDAALWEEAASAMAATAWEDDELSAAIEARDQALLAARFEDWDAGKQPLPPPDRAVMKRALKAFRKRLKLQQLDDESRIGGGPFSKGLDSKIVAIQPPGPYPSEVWEELCRHRRLNDAGHGFYELGEEA